MADTQAAKEVTPATEAHVEKVTTEQTAEIKEVVAEQSWAMKLAGIWRQAVAAVVIIASMFGVQIIFKPTTPVAPDVGIAQLIEVFNNGVKAGKEAARPPAGTVPAAGTIPTSPAIDPALRDVLDRIDRRMQLLEQKAAPKLLPDKASVYQGN
jgi:hypothetical protein